MSYTISAFSGSPEPITPKLLAERLAQKGWGVLHFLSEGLYSADDSILWDEENYPIVEDDETHYSVDILGLPKESAEWEAIREHFASDEPAAKRWLNHNGYACASLTIYKGWTAGDDVKEDVAETWGNDVVAVFERSQLEYVFSAGGHYESEGNAVFDQGKFADDLKEVMSASEGMLAIDDEIEVEIIGNNA